MRGSFVCGAGAALAMFVACSSFEDAADEPSAPDSGTNDAPGDDAPSTDAASGDGAIITDGGADSDAAPPEGMVLVQTAATSFWIDAREVTTGEFLAFKEKVVQQNVDAGFPAVCSFKGGLGPTENCNGMLPSTAVGCVDWCDAFVYCKNAGKRLCGRIGGGAPLTGLEAKDRIASEWMRACTGPNGASTWPYGSVPDAAACNTQDHGGGKVFDAGSLPGCVGGEPGLFDMSGNVAELTDSCEGVLGVSDTCYAQGGSFVDPLYSSRCEDRETFNRGTSAMRIGFRCCKDP